MVQAHAARIDPTIRSIFGAYSLFADSAIKELYLDDITAHCAKIKPIMDKKKSVF